METKSQTTFEQMKAADRTARTFRERRVMQSLRENTAQSVVARHGTLLVPIRAGREGL